ncbi:MAG TPA: hypothetical protein VF053_09855 [Streptosporangiales bacterium]
MARPRAGQRRRITAALLVLLFVSSLFALSATASDSGHHARAHPVAHAVKDAGKFLVGSGVRTSDTGGWPAVGTVTATVLALLALAALRDGRRDAAGRQCDPSATSSRGPPVRPVLA